MAYLSATNSKRLENTIVGMHALAGRIGSRQLSQTYHDGRLRISRVRMTEYIVEYSQLVGIYSTDTSAAPPEIYEGVLKLAPIWSLPPRKQWALDVHPDSTPLYFSNRYTLQI